MSTTDHDEQTSQKQDPHSEPTRGQQVRATAVGYAREAAARVGSVALAGVTATVQALRDAGPGASTSSSTAGRPGAGAGGRSMVLARAAASVRNGSGGWRSRAKRLVVLFVIAQLIVFCDQWLIAPGGPLVEPSACQTATGESVAGKSPVIVMARAQGQALRGLSGPPPDPATTKAWAKDAADQVVVAWLALTAAARGQADPAAVTAHEASTAADYQAQQVSAQQACAPCPANGGTPDAGVQSASLSTTAVACGTVTSAAGAAGGAPSTSEKGATGAWGHHANGRIPAEALCAPATHPGHRLRCDAATALAQLAAAFEADTGKPLVLTDSYRDFDGQVATKAKKGRMAATPGKSQHGWGLAVDLGGGIQTFGSPEHEWMRANASRFGWVHPGWAQAGGSKPEPWHWEYTGTAATSTARAEGSA